MKTISAGLLAHFQGEVTTIATCWKITRTDGTVSGYTNHVKNIVYSGVTYSAATGYTASNIHSNADLSVDNLDVYSLLDSSGISASDLRAGLYDYSNIEIFQVNYEDLTQGSVTLKSGILGEVTIKDNVFTAEIRSLSQLLQQNVGEAVSPTCRALLGDTRCSVVLEPAEWAASTVYALGDIISPSSYDTRRYICTTAGTTLGSEPTWDTTIGNTTADNTVVWTTYEAYVFSGSPTSVTSNKLFADTSIINADDFFKGGLLTWLTGNNAGYSMEVKKFTATGGVFTLFKSMANTIQTSDTYKVTAGCNKLTATCKAFSPENGAKGNIYNFRGEPFLPGNDKLSKFGGQ